MDPSAFQDSPSGRLVWAPGQYWAFVPHPLPPDLAWTPKLVSVLSEADRAFESFQPWVFCSLTRGC